MTRLEFLAMLSIVTITFCSCTANYVQPTEGPTADLTFDIESNSEGKSLSVTVYKLDKQDCKNVELVGKDMFSKSGNFRYGPMKVMAQSPFFFMATYSRHLSIASTVGCPTFGEFIPLANKKYVVKFNVDISVDSCDLNIYQQNSTENLKPVEFDFPVKACVLGKEYINGKATGVSYRATVTR